MSETEFTPNPVQCREAYRLLRLVDAEWLTDPMSLVCFDLRLVRQARALIVEVESDRENSGHGSQEMK